MSFERLAPEQFDTILDIAEPAENPVLVGHEEAVAHVAEAYQAGRLHHALLLSGPPGIGKATFAFHLARHLLANPDHEHAPDRFSPLEPSSSVFRQVAQGAHPGVLHLTRPVNDKTKAFKSVVTVDEIRKVNRFLAMTSHDGSYRVAIVDPADDMNTNAANALLKTLEEPPARTLFILISHTLGSLLPTIRSRCQSIKLKPLADHEVLKVLSHLDAALPDDATGQSALIGRAGGSVREALLLTQFGGLDIADAITRTVSAPEFNVTDALKVAEAMSGRDSAVQFEIFNQTALDIVAGWARSAAVEQNVDAAARFSELWQDCGRIMAEADAYNLDKKQHVNGLLRRMWLSTHS